MLLYGNQKVYIVLIVTISMNKLKKVELMELNEAYQKMLIWFFSFPDVEIGLNDLSGELKISKTTAKKIVNQLIKEEFLSRKIIGKNWRISCNGEHHYNYSRKVAYNLTMVYESGILDYIHKLVGNSKVIILFGSYRKGDDNEKSDIDMAVEVLDDKEQEISEIGVIPNFGHRKNVVVNLHKFSKNKVDLNLFSNIANGIVLEGFLEVKK